MSKEVQDKIKEIASKYLSLETLDVQNSDDKDFHDLAVWDIERALMAAFEAGVVDQADKAAVFDQIWGKELRYY